MVELGGFRVFWGSMAIGKVYSTSKAAWPTFHQLAHPLSCSRCYINIADADAEAAAQGNADVLKDGNRVD